MEEGIRTLGERSKGQHNWYSQRRRQSSMAHIGYSEKNG